MAHPTQTGIQDEPQSISAIPAAAAAAAATTTTTTTEATLASDSGESSSTNSMQASAAPAPAPTPTKESATPKKAQDGDAAAKGAESSDDAKRQLPAQEEDEAEQGESTTRNESPLAGILSPLAGLFGGGGNLANINGENRSRLEVDAVESANSTGSQHQQEQSSVPFDLEAASEATQTASDTACSCSSTTTDGETGDQQSGDEDSLAKASPPSSPNRSATILAKGSFASTDPSASLGDEDFDGEDWIENDPSAIAGTEKTRKAKASDTTAKVLPIGSCCRRYKRQLLHCLALLVLMAVLMGAGIVIGIKIAKPTAATTSASSNGSVGGDVKESPPAPKPDETNPADDAEEGIKTEPAQKPAGTDSYASADDTSSSLVNESQPLEEPLQDTSSAVTDTEIDIPTSTGDGTLFNDPSSTTVEEEESDDGGDSYTYEPGNLQTLKNGVFLSKGLDCEIIAKTGKNVKFSGKSAVSSDTFHARPDFGATFPTDNGGWVYVSNSEVANKKGGVGAIYFDKNAKVIDYKMLLKKTSMNCGGGRTPWDTWISCEEIARDGQIWEVDPLGVREAKMTVLGGTNTGGRFESFTYDVRNKEDPQFYYTEDRPNGALRRFRPTNPDWNKPHNMLHGTGDIEYLLLDATAADNSTGTYRWTKNKKQAEVTAAEFFPGSEGIDAYEGSLYFVSKKAKLMYVLDLDGNQWERRSTVSGVFDGAPDQLTRLVGEQEILYYTEEGGKDAGIHGRDSEGNFFSILESPVYNEETTGLAFSPNHKRMYVAYQANGILLEVWRKDGLPFSAKSLNIKYHNTQSGTVRN